MESSKRPQRVQAKVKSKAKVKSSVDPHSVANIGQVGKDVYIVEKVVGKKFIETDNGPLAHYFIKWKGWASMHNTWEPVENLDGCTELLEAFEAALKKKRSKAVKGMSGIDIKKEVYVEEEDDVEEENFNLYRSDLGRIAHELKEFGIMLSWPKTAVPILVIGCLTIDNHLCYLVKIKESDGTKQLSTTNVLIIRAVAFRHLYPQLIIRFYEKSLHWVKREETLEELGKKAATAIHDNRTGYNSAKSPDDKNNEIGEADNAEESEDEIEKLDERGGDDEEQTIFIKKGYDIFGLPDDMDSSDSGESDDMFVPIKAPSSNSKKSAESKKLNSTEVLEVVPI